jgi:sugar phosphate isomerase/epimerase
MGTLTVLPGGGAGGPTPPDMNDAARLLERVLAIAKENGVVNVAIAWTPPEGGACSCYSAEDGGVALLGAVTVLQARMVQEIRS